MGTEMRHFIRMVKIVGAFCGAVIAAGTLMGMLNQALLDHLDRTFVTKTEFVRQTVLINGKLDKLLNHKR